MNTNTYNGWSNYATWRVNLEIVDDMVSHLSNDIRDGNLRAFESVAALADYLKDDAWEAITGYGEIADDTLMAGYAQAFLSQVDWHEIAESHATGDDAHLIASDEDTEDEQEQCFVCQGNGTTQNGMTCFHCNDEDTQPIDFNDLREAFSR